MKYGVWLFNWQVEIESKIHSLQIAGRAWFDHFMNRPKETLSLRMSEGTLLDRSIRLKKRKLNALFDLVKTESSMHHNAPNCI